MAFLFAFLGMLGGHYLGEKLTQPLYLALGVMVCLFLLFGAKNNGVIPIFLLFLGLGFGLSFLYFPGADGVGEFKGVVIEVKRNYFIFQSGLSRYYVYERDCLREVGDIVSIYGKVSDYSFASYEGRFDFGDYLLDKGVAKRLSIYEVEEIFLFPLRIRERAEVFLSNFSADTASLLESLLFNRKDYDSALIETASSLSLISLFSSSGLYYSLFLRGIQRLLGLKLDEDKAKLLSIIPALALLLLFSGKIGLYRVFLILLLSNINTYLLKGRFSYLEIMPLSGIILLFLDHNLANQSGFLLGYGLSLSFYLSRLYLSKGERWLRKVKSLLLIHAFILPFSLSYSGLHLFLPLFSQISLPFAFIYLLIGLVSFLTIPFTGPLEWLSGVVGGLLTIFDKLDVCLPLPMFSESDSFIYYCLLFFFLFLLEFSLRRLKKVSALSLLCLYAFSLVPIPNLFLTRVSFINVGQGDSILIEHKGTSIMIDTGGNLSFDMAEEVLIPYLRKRRVYKLDAIFTTHEDYDHMGARESLLSNFKVSETYDYDDVFPIKVGDITLDNLNDYGTDSDENSKSLVLYTELMGKRWLFMGDAPTSVEEKIIGANPNLDCDILKVGHHGSDTSTSLPFLLKTTPEEAIISCGLGNSYGHPHESVLKSLRLAGVGVRRTDQEGTIVYQSFAL